MMPGEFEERLKAVLNEVSQQRGRVILFIDDIHNLVPAAGAAVGDEWAGGWVCCLVHRVLCVSASACVR
jgi:ATP-dependent Clp protease ATP-binding subunit ClpB